jgi:hypothetical protein
MAAGKGRRNGSAKRKRGGKLGVPSKWTNLPNGKPVELPGVAAIVIRLGQALAVLPNKA